MTGPDAATGTDARQDRRWDVALSFAGAQRAFVGQVAEALKARGIRCFYDADEQVRLWGTHLSEELPQIYTRESAAVVVFISSDYTGRDWTRLERRAAFSRAVTEAGANVLPARFDDSELPGLLPDVVSVDLRHYSPEQFAELVIAKLADLAVSPSSVPGKIGARPAGGVRVSDTDPQRLGVHTAISVSGVPDEVMPEYVPRDADTAEFGVRAKVADAARRGGFVLLVGGSSLGKTRCAVEAVKALLTEWWLVHPAGPVEVAALARAPAPHTVVWLDEMQRYLDGEQGLTGSVVRALLNVSHPAVIIGTLWPHRYTAYTAVPIPGGDDPYTREREVLGLATVVRIDPEFSPAEQSRARAAAARDRRLEIALESAGYGLTQTLAAAPQLVARWQDAKTADMAHDEVTRNLNSMDDLDFTAWNGADWHGLFARYHTDDVLVDVHGQPPTHGIEEHIDAMKAMVQATGGTPAQIRSHPIKFGSGNWTCVVGEFENGSRMVTVAKWRDGAIAEEYIWM